MCVSHPDRACTPPCARIRARVRVRARIRARVRVRARFLYAPVRFLYAGARVLLGGGGGAVQRCGCGCGGGVAVACGVVVCRRWWVVCGGCGWRWVAVLLAVAASLFLLSALFSRRWWCCMPLFLSTFLSRRRWYRGMYRYV